MARGGASARRNKLRPKICNWRGAARGQALEVLAQARAGCPRRSGHRGGDRQDSARRGPADGALTEFGRALALAPQRRARTINNRGVALEALGQTEARARGFRAGAAHRSALAEARENLRKQPLTVSLRAR